LQGGRQGGYLGVTGGEGKLMFYFKAPHLAVPQECDKSQAIRNVSNQRFREIDSIKSK